MLDRIHEEDEVHGVLGAEIIVCEVIFNDGYHLVLVADLLVLALIAGCAHFHIIAKAQSTIDEEVLEGEHTVEVLAVELDQHLQK